MTKTFFKSKPTANIVDKNTIFLSSMGASSLQWLVSISSSVESSPAFSVDSCRFVCRRSDRSDRRVDKQCEQRLRQEATHGVPTDRLQAARRSHVRHIGWLSVTWTSPLPGLASNGRLLNVHARLGIPLHIACCWRTTWCKPCVPHLKNRIKCFFNIGYTFCGTRYLSHCRTIYLLRLWPQKGQGRDPKIF